MENDLSTLGKRIKFLLKKEKKTQKWFAELLKVHINTVGSWVRGEFEPNVATLRFISNFFNVDHTWLLTGETATEYAERREMRAMILKDDGADYNKNNVTDRMKILEDIANKLPKLDDDSLEIVRQLISKMGGSE